MLTTILHTAIQISEYSTIIYIIAFFSAFLETLVGIGMILPGSTVILLLGMASITGKFNIIYLIIYAVLGAILGDNLNYYIGKKLGKKWLKNGVWFIKKSHLNTVNDFFKKNGKKSIFLGRFIPSIKETIPLFAGASDMKMTTFMFWNALGAIGWVIEIVGIGYLFSQSLTLAETWLMRVGFILASILIFFIFLYVIKVLIERYISQVIEAILYTIKAPFILLLKNKHVDKLIKKYPKTFKFISNRFSTKNFYGMPLTFISLSIIYILSLLQGIIEGILKSEIITKIDVRFSNLLSIFRTPELNTIFYWITMFSKWEVILTFTLSLIIILLIFNKKKYITPLVVSILGSQLFVQITKLIIHRTRPINSLFIESSYSFPSGHAAMSIAFYGFITYILTKNIKRWDTKINIIFAEIIITIIIGFSRLYLGVHFLSDVIGGYLIGIMWLIIAISIYENGALKTNKSMDKKKIKIPKLLPKILSITIVILSLLFYVSFSLQYTPQEQVKIKNTPIVVENITDIFRKNPKLKFSETLTGRDQAPISIIIVTKNGLILKNALTKSGWKIADKLDIYSITKAAKAMALKEQYDEAPMTPSFWNSKVNNIGIQRNTKINNLTQRHHARFWNTNYLTKNGDKIFVGTASFDIGIKWNMIHKISPDIDTERDFLLETLKDSDTIKNIEIIQLERPFTGNNMFGDKFYTDGKQYIIYLKNSII